MNTYRIQVCGQVNVDELAQMSPVHMTPAAGSPVDTCFTISTDQSGLLGLLRHLHNLQIEILSCQKEIFTSSAPSAESVR